MTDMKSSILEDLNKFIDEWDFNEYRQQIIDHAKGCLGLKSLVEEDYSSIGNCRFGGDPDLPLGWEYPVKNNRSALFIAQFDLKYVNSVMKTKLPETGYLYFFLLDDDSRPEECKVLYYNGDSSNLRRTKSNSWQRNIWEDEVKLKGCKVELCPAFFLPETLTHIDDDLCDAYGLFGLNNEEVDNQTSLFGYPYLLLGNPATSAYLYSNNLEYMFGYSHIKSRESLEDSIKAEKRCLDYKLKNKRSEIKELSKAWGNRKNAKQSVLSSIYNAKNSYENIIKMKDKIINYIDNRDSHKKEMNKWNMLFSISSFNQCNMCWGDAGYLQFLIHDDDLEIGDFSKIYCCTQA